MDRGGAAHDALLPTSPRKDAQVSAIDLASTLLALPQSACESGRLLGDAWRFRSLWTWSSTPRASSCPAVLQVTASVLAPRCFGHGICAADLRDLQGPWRVAWRPLPPPLNVIFGEESELGMATMTPKRHTTSTWQSPLMPQGLPAAAKAHHNVGGLLQELMGSRARRLPSPRRGFLGARCPRLACQYEIARSVPGLHGLWLDHS